MQGGISKTVEYQIEQTSKLLSSERWRKVETKSYAPLHGAITDWYDSLERQPVLLRTDVPFSLIGPAVDRVKSLAPAKELLIDFGSGKVSIGLSGLEQDAWEQLCQWCVASGAAILAERVPDRFKELSDVFGLPKPDGSVSRHIKSALDPENLFSPGKLAGNM